MEEAPAKRRWFHRNRRPIAVIILLILIPPTTVYAINLINQIILENNPELDPFYEPEYNLTVWIAAEETEFHLHLDFYGSEQDLYSEVNRFSGFSIRVEPYDNEENNLYLYTIPRNQLSIWVKIYFDEDTEEPNIIVEIEMGKKLTTQLLGREISILVEPLPEESQ